MYFYASYDQRAFKSGSVYESNGGEVTIWNDAVRAILGDKGRLRSA